MRVRGVQIEPVPGQYIRKTFSIQSPAQRRAIVVRTTEASEAHADVAERLKNIESELKQIRKLLKEMQKAEAEK